MRYKSRKLIYSLKLEWCNSKILQKTWFAFWRKQITWFISFLVKTPSNKLEGNTLRVAFNARWHRFHSYASNRPRLGSILQHAAAPPNKMTINKSNHSSARSCSQVSRLGNAVWCLVTDHGPGHKFVTRWSSAHDHDPRGSPVKCGEWPCLKRLAEDVSWHFMLSWGIEIVESFESAILIGFVFGVEEFHAFKIIISFVQLEKSRTSFFQFFFCLEILNI